jgi:hypothetical protein
MHSSTRHDSGPGGALEGARVLVVEDDVMILMHLEAILSEAKPSQPAAIVKAVADLLYH